LVFRIGHLCDKTSREVRYSIFSKIMLNSVYKKRGVWPLKTAQTFGFCRAVNVLIGISNEGGAMNDSKILH